MVPFTAGINESAARAWAEQQHGSSLRGGGSGTTMHVVRDAAGTIWVIAESERERFAKMTGGNPTIVSSVPEAGGNQQ